MIKKFLIISLVLLGLANFALAQKPISPSKQKLVSTLIAKTSAIIPSETIDSLFKDVQREKAVEMQKGITDSIVSKIDSSDKLSAQEKADIKAKVPELSQKLAELSMKFIGKDFTVKNWVNESFQKHYSSKFTISELQKLNTYFQTAGGKSMVEHFKYFIIGEINDTKNKPDDKTVIQIGTFLKTKIGNKFFNVFLENIFGEVMQKTDAWGKKALNEIDKSLESGEMKKLLEDFVNANVKS